MFIAILYIKTSKPTLRGQTGLIYPDKCDLWSTFNARERPIHGNTAMVMVQQDWRRGESTRLDSRQCGPLVEFLALVSDCPCSRGFSTGSSVTPFPPPQKSTLKSFCQCVTLENKSFAISVYIFMPNPSVWDCEVLVFQFNFAKQQEVSLPTEVDNESPSPIY